MSAAGGSSNSQPSASVKPANSFISHERVDYRLAIRNLIAASGLVDKQGFVTLAPTHLEIYRAAATRPERPIISPTVAPPWNARHNGGMVSLLVRCAGVVTVNSSVGALALAQGKPVHALGRALYVLTGLSDPGPLARFWADPQAPAPGAYESFRRALWNECLLNAGFHSREGLARLAPLAAERMLEKAA